VKFVYRLILPVIILASRLAVADSLMESRLLSKIPFPDNKNCESDTSDNGQLL
jgi:hypothetical protein